jgi:hypothetical protein
MRYNSPAFLAWQEAEHLASEAERRLFAKLCDAAGNTLPTQDEVKETRALRENASRRMKEMLEEMRVLADSLKYSGARRGGMIDTRHADQGSEP